MKNKKIAVASDHAGFALREDIAAHLAKQNYRVINLGTCSLDSCDYPEFAYRLAREISSGKTKKGILVCKSGIGNSIVANKLPNVRAALCYNVQAARLSREHNDSNILVLGSAFVGKRLARRIVSVWLRTEFLGGRHKRRLNKIRQIEKGLYKS